MAKIADLIDIPERVHQGDFVLKLTEGVRNEADTLKSYVVTPQLAQSFDQALGLIQSAVEGGRSKAAYLHGSFGSGKSHFMAVLSLLLEGHAAARAVQELAPVVTRHNAWTEGRRFLVVPYHLIGATSLESAVLGGYARFVRERHPEARTPGFYRAEKLFADARHLRETMGDAAFFDALGGAADADAGWGALDTAWDGESFDAALAAEPGSEDRVRLVSDLVDSFFGAHRDLAGDQEEGFVSIDEGLSVLAKHARGLGYDAVVLFLDELLLWLASRAADGPFVSRETQKLVKLVEAQQMDRPIPIVSFIARQRDLRELVSEHLPGADQLSFGHRLDHMEGRFETITLEDRNLPAIVSRRLLRPVSDEAAKELKDAFEAFERGAAANGDVLSTLLTKRGDRTTFEQVYPFSPALVDTLIAVSSLLQRERTALKLLLQLLVDQRETLEVGDLVPVGDLYDVIASGDEPFSQAMKDRFDQARRLYREKLVPFLERQHSVTAEAVAAGTAPAAKRRAFQTDARLAKTLILSALADGVEALSALTPARLAALNHGTVRTPIPGGEAQVVLSKVQRWAGDVGEIKISGDDANPTISVHLVGVDTDGILENAKATDNRGNRIRKVRELLFEMAEVPPSDGSLLTPRRTLLWRGTERTFEVAFTNVRTQPIDQFEPDQAPWRLLIDYPFDEAGFTPADDRARIQEFAQSRPDGAPARTIAWVPNFLTPSALDELGRLVVLDHVLSGTRLEEYGSHLSQVDRGQARALLENQRSQVRQRVKNALLAAYGVSDLRQEAVDSAHLLERNVFSVDPSFQPQPPVGAGFRAAMEHLFGQALAYQYPDHPTFEGEVKPAGLRRVWEVVQRAASAPNGRAEVRRPERDDVRRIAVPLGLGTMGESHFVLDDRWKQDLDRHHTPGETLTVRALREWIDTRPRGLTRPLQDLIALTYALQTDRAFVHAGTPVQPEIGTLHPEMELREQPLPDADTWDGARQVAAAVLGVEVAPVRNATNVGRLIEETQRVVRTHEGAVDAYAKALEAREAAAPGAPRRRTAEALRDLLASVQSAPPPKVAAALAQARTETSADAMRTALSHSDGLCRAVEAMNWALIEQDTDLPPDLAERAAAVKARVRDALQHDEHVMALAPVLRQAQTDLVGLMQRALAQSAPPNADAPAPAAPRADAADPARAESTGTLLSGSEVRMRGRDMDDALSALREAAQASPDSWFTVHWSAEEPDA